MVMRAESSSPWSDAWKRFRKNRVAFISLFVVLFLVLVSLTAPYVAPFKYDQPDLQQASQGPSAQHWLGTDRLGRDILSRAMWGARASLTLGFCVQLASLVIGVLLGAFAGYYGGWLDTLIMRLADVLFAFPLFLFAVLVSAIFGQGLTSLAIALIIEGWADIARLTRGQVLGVKEETMVEAARAGGLPDAVIVLKHILPNVMAPLIIRATMGISSVILVESGMSFLGIGIQPPMPSWGSMISDGCKYLRQYPYMTILPSIILSATVLSFNFLGDGLRDALDPRQ